MTIMQILDSNIVVNTIEKGDRFDEMLLYIYENRKIWTNLNVLWDVTVMFESGSSFSDEVFAGFEQLAGGPDRTGRKTALLVESDLSFGMARMFQTMAETKLTADISIFKSRQDAMDWLSS